MESLAHHLFRVLFRHTGTEPGVLFVLLCDHSLHCPTFYIRLPVIIHFLAVGPASRSEATVEEDRTGPCHVISLSLLRLTLLSFLSVLMVLYRTLCS